jgi:ATP/maltotriose-dependent transcriptional regulator MalT
MIARALTQLGEVARLEGNLTEARSLFERTIPMWRENRHGTGLVDSLRGLGDVARLEGGFAAAQLLLEESLSVCREIGARPGIAAALQSLADLAGARRDVEGAKGHYREALTLWGEMEHPDGIARCTQGLAKAEVVEGRLDLAAVLLGESEALRDQIGAIVPPVERPHYDRVMATTRDTLGETVFLEKWNEGQKLGRRAAALGVGRLLG